MAENGIWRLALPLAIAQVLTQATKLQGELRQGKVIASFFTEGGQLKNDSRVQYEQIVLSSEQEAKEAERHDGVHEPTIKIFVAQ